MCWILERQMYVCVICIFTRKVVEKLIRFSTLEVIFNSSDSDLVSALRGKIDNFQ